MDETKALIQKVRKEYQPRGLERDDMPADPVTVFKEWFEAAVAAGLDEPNGMTLATSTVDGRPSARIVLLKSFDERGFVFYTNYESRKGRELVANPAAALVFWWAKLERQVRIEGAVAAVSAAESDAYFAARPRGSQIGAWTSPQSRPIPNREALQERQRQVQAQFEVEEAVSRPPNWGGFRLSPQRIEFWQGRPNRLHDRFLYEHTADGWTVTRLAP